MSISAAQERLIREVGSPEKIYEDLTKFRRDVTLLAQQRPKLTKKHPNKWIAFYNGNVLFIADTLDDLLQLVDKEGLPRDKVVTQFLSTQKRIMIL